MGGTKVEPFAAAWPVSSDLVEGAVVVLEDGAAFNGGPFFCPNDSAMVGYPDPAVTDDWLAAPLGALEVNGPPDSGPALGLAGGADIGVASDEAFSFGRALDAVCIDATEDEGFGEDVGILTVVEEAFGPADVSSFLVGSVIPDSEVALKGVDGLDAMVPSPLSLISGSLAGLPELVAFPAGISAFVKALGIAFAGGAEDDEAS